MNGTAPPDANGGFGGGAGFPDGFAGFPPGGFPSFSTTGGPSFIRFSSTASPGGGGRFGGFHDDIFSHLFGDRPDPDNVFQNFFRTRSTMDTDDDDDPGMLFSGRSSRMGSTGRPFRRKAPPIEHKLFIPLEDLYTGTTKKMKLTKQVYDEAARRHLPVEKTLQLDIRPGLKGGTQFKFECEGDEEPGVEPADIIFKIVEKPHQNFVRDGNDLVFKAKVPLEQALTGAQIEVPLLTGKTLRIRYDEVLQPGDLKLIPNYGMPRKSGGFGDLRLSIDVIFPKQLSEQQKAAIKSLGLR